MTLFNDPAGMLLAAFDWSGEEHYRAALDGLGVELDPAWHDRLMSNLHGIWVEYRLFQGRRPDGREVAAAVEGIASACLEIDRHLETLLAARMSAPPNAPDRAAALLGLYPVILTALFPELASHEWDERQPGDAPRRWEFTRRGHKVRAAGAALGAAQLAKTTRPVDPAFDRLIARLAELFLEVTGEPPASSSKGDDNTYRSRFAAMVEAYWPCIGTPPPGPDKIGAALKRVGELR